MIRTALANSPRNWCGSIREARAQSLLGTVHLAAGRMGDAITAFNHAASAEASDFTIRHQQLIALARAEDWSAARAVAAEILNRFGTTDDPFRANAVAWACSLIPGAIQDREAPVRLATLALRRVPADQRSGPEYSGGDTLPGRPGGRGHSEAQRRHSSPGWT